MAHGMKNASYRSAQIRNEIIDICANVIRENIVKRVKGTRVYSILTDETANISGKK